MFTLAHNSASPWPHRLAMLVASLTFPLIWVGGLVTTYEAGMAVPDWPNTYGYNLFLYPWQTWLFGPWDLFIEHGHRLLGATVGLATIALLFALVRGESRAWVRWLGPVCLAAVILQGLLGGLRVVLDDRSLARLHGCVGPAFFAFAVALVGITSPWWRAATPTTHPQSARFQRLSLVTAVLAYGQIVLGALVRHMPATGSPSAFRTLVLFHILLALVLLAHSTMLWIAARRLRSVRLLWHAALALGVLVPLQVLLGSGTWIANYGVPALLPADSFLANYTVQAQGQVESLVTTAHVAIGSLILATAVTLALRAGRLLAGGASRTLPTHAAPMLLGSLMLAEVSR